MTFSFQRAKPLTTPSKSGALQRKHDARHGKNTSSKVRTVSTASENNASATVGLGLDEADSPHKSQVGSLIEQGFGRSFSDVQVHMSDSLGTSVDDFNLLAYTTDSHRAFSNQFPAHHETCTKPNRLQCVWQSVQRPTRLPPIGSANVIQRKKKKDPLGPKLISGKTVPQALKEVRKVKSLKMDLQATQIKDAQDSLAKAMQRREDEIAKLLKELEEYRGQKWADNKRRDLEAARLKTAEQLQDQSQESKWLVKGPWKDVKRRFDYLKRKKAAVAARRRKYPFDRLDKTFSDKSVVDSLQKSGITSAELKAQLAQESADFTTEDTKGDIAGIAQMGKAAVQSVGMTPKDRLDEKKAPLIAARYLAWNKRILDRALTKVSGDEMKWFVIAAYNAGHVAIRKLGSEATTWDSAIAGGQKSQLYKALESTKRYGKKGARPKYDEVVSYVERIKMRLGLEKITHE